MSFQASCGFISSSSTATLVKDFLNRSVWCVFMTGQVDKRGVGEQKRGEHVLVRKVTSQSTDPVALFGVNVHSRGVRRWGIAPFVAM